MKTKTILFSGLFALSYISQATAQTEDRPDKQPGVSFDQLLEHYPEASEDRFNALDINGDGLLTRRERNAASDRPHDRVTDRARDRFTEIDTDGSGGLSLDEIQAGNPDATGDRFARLDRNGDGELGQVEARHAAKKRFDRRPDFQQRPTEGQRRGGQPNRQRASRQ